MSNEYILENAISSIILGLEDYKSDNPKRVNLSSIRNIFAGMILLFKYKLCELEPKVSGQDGIPDIIKYGNNGNTINVKKIKEKFQQLNIDVDWDKIENTQNYRNDIEHYFNCRKINNNTIGKMILDIFLIINKFICTHLNEAPCYLFNEMNENYQDFLIKFIEGRYEINLHLAYIKGEILPMTECPDCLELTFLHDEDVCINCGNDTIRYECQRCLSDIEPSEMEYFPLCGYCNYVMNKDD